VLIESQRFHSQGQGVVPPPFGRLQSQTRPCSASMFPSGNFEVTLGTSWVLCRGLPLKAEVAGGQATWLGISHATIRLEVAPTLSSAHCFSSTTNSTEQAHAVLHPTTYWVTDYSGAACFRAFRASSVPYQILETLAQATTARERVLPLPSFPLTSKSPIIYVT